MKFKRLIASVLSVACMIACAAIPSGAEVQEASEGIEATEYDVPRLPDNIRLSDIVNTEPTEPVSDYGIGGEYESAYIYRIYRGLTDAQKTELDDAAAEIIAGIDSSWSDLAKVLYVHDVITSTRAYDYTFSKYTAYENLVNKTSVCQGYAEAFWLLMYKLNIDCKVVASNSLNHAWNIVKVGGNWYHIDLTWDDPSTNKVDVPGRSFHTYFLLSDNAINTVDEGNHSASDFCLQFEGSASAFNYAVSTKYDSGWFWEGGITPIPIIDNYYFSVKNKWIIKANDSNTTSQLIDLTDRKWYLIDNPYGYWMDCFAGLAYNGKTLYYSDATKVYSCDVNGQNTEVVYELPKSETTKHYIYGLLPCSDGCLNIKLGSTPSTVTEIRQIKIAQESEKISVKATPGNYHVNLSWQPISGATKYRVHYRLNGTTTWTTDETTGTSYTVSNLSNGKEYEFLVLVYDGSSWSKWTSEDIVKSAPINAPPSFTVKVAKGGRTVTFNCDDPDAIIYYSTKTGTLTTSDSCVKPGETVLFKSFYGTLYARAYYKGRWSNVARNILRIPTVNTPTITKLSNGKYKIKTTTPSSMVYFTIDGSTPSETNYYGKFWSSCDYSLPKGKTVKAIATRFGFTDSGIGTGNT